jgi:hypothetical protein
MLAGRAAVDADVTFRRAPSFSGLEPGAFIAHTQVIPIDIVLIGFDPNDINRSDLAALLPATSAPAIRYPQFYGLEGRAVGLEYEFKYTLTRKSRQFEDQFFQFLTRTGTPGNPTVYMNAYNNQTRNLVNVTGPVLYVDGRASKIGSRRNATPRKNGYTVYFINWYGREDFRFHAYTRRGDPDRDTGVDFGNFQSSAMVSWGGTRSRSWFYDFSAGPEWNTANWFVDATDLNGDGVEEYRMPPIWEYADGGYRHADALGYDMGLLARYVAIDLLFTPSPLTDPLVTAPGALGRKVAEINMFEDDAASSGIDFIDTGFARESWERLQPYYAWRTALRDVAPIDAGAKQSLNILPATAMTRAAGRRSAIRSRNCSASSTSTSPRTCRHIRHVITSLRSSRSTRLRTDWATSSGCLDSPMTTGSTARRPSCSRSTLISTARSAMASPARSFMKSGITSGCRIRMTASIPRPAWTSTRAVNSSSRGRATRARR